jgi:3'(2'), 5'-bisphosphate nucleotidase
MLLLQFDECVPVLHQIEIEFKADKTPLTIADKEAHQSITSALSELTPNIPILSEESSRLL